MAFYKTLFSVSPVFILIFVSVSSPASCNAQQSGFQLSLLAPAASGGALSALGISADIVETRNESYLKTLERIASEKNKPFQPSASDLLVEQAEDRFKAGRKYYRVNDSDRARTEFDAAVDLMIQASVNPSNRTLYENKLDELVDSIHHLDLAGLGAEAPSVDVQAQFDKAPLEDILETTFPVDPRLKFKVSEQLIATSSGLPLVMNDAVLSYINYFNGNGRGTIVAGFQRAGKYRPMIERVLAEEGVPQELIYLAQAESGFYLALVSDAAAGGMWQFIRERGNQYGLGQTAYSDDRYDPERQLAPPLVICAICIPNSGTGIWPLQRTTVDRVELSRPCREPATRISGSCVPAGRFPPKPPIMSLSSWR